LLNSTQASVSAERCMTQLMPYHSPWSMGSLSSSVLLHLYLKPTIYIYGDWRPPIHA